MVPFFILTKFVIMNDNKALAIFFIAAFLMMTITISMMEYQKGQTERTELILKIEQEKTKQLINKIDTIDVRNN